MQVKFMMQERGKGREGSPVEREGPGVGLAK